MNSDSGAGEPVSSHWPSVELDDVHRLRVLAAYEGHRMPAERVLPLPFETVWSVAGDLETELPQLVRGPRSFRITGATADRGRLIAVATSLLRPGWCLLRARTVVGCMAAVPEGDSARFAFFGGLRMPPLRAPGPAACLGRRALTAVGQPVTAARVVPILMVLSHWVAVPEDGWYRPHLR